MKHTKQAAQTYGVDNIVLDLTGMRPELSDEVLMLQVPAMPFTAPVLTMEFRLLMEEYEITESELDDLLEKFLRGVRCRMVLKALADRLT